MQNPKIDIYKSLLINRMVVYALLIAFVTASIIFAISLNTLYSKQLNTVLVIDPKGEIIPMQWMDRNENITVEIKNHLELFHRYFYEFDANNLDKRVEKALWLADQSAEQIYIKRSNDGWYNKVKMYGFSQTIEIQPDQIQVIGNKEPYQFKVTANVSIKQNDVTTNFSFETIGQIVFVSRNYPLNPHGLLITNLVETNRKQL